MFTQKKFKKRRKTQTLRAIIHNTTRATTGEKRFEKVFVVGICVRKTRSTRTNRFITSSIMSKNAEEIIKSHAELFPPLQVKLALKLCSNECDQGHLFSDWDSTSRGDDAKKKKMMLPAGAFGQKLPTRRSLRVHQKREETLENTPRKGKIHSTGGTRPYQKAKTLNTDRRSTESWRKLV